MCKKLIFDERKQLFHEWRFPYFSKMGHIMYKLGRKFETCSATRPNGKNQSFWENFPIILTNKNWILIYDLCIYWIHSHIWKGRQNGKNLNHICFRIQTFKFQKAIKLFRVTVKPHLIHAQGTHSYKFA